MVPVLIPHQAPRTGPCFNGRKRKHGKTNRRRNSRPCARSVGASWKARRARGRVLASRRTGLARKAGTFRDIYSTRLNRQRWTKIVPFASASAGCVKTIPTALGMKNSDASAARECRANAIGLIRRIQANSSKKCQRRGIERRLLSHRTNGGPTQQTTNEKPGGKTGLIASIV
jgi:hypothetical protein